MDFFGFLVLILSLAIIALFIIDVQMSNTTKYPILTIFCALMMSIS